MVPPGVDVSHLNMKHDKTELLRQHRRNKRMMLFAAAAMLLLSGVIAGWWFVPLFALGLWLSHEAWFSDHLFYSPRSDYHFALAGDWDRTASIESGQIKLAGPLPAADTLVFSCRIESNLAGHFLDPWLDISGQRFHFERGSRGQRHWVMQQTNEMATAENIKVHTHHCQLHGPLHITGFRNPDFSEQRLLVLAPHADDAELAAFGLYQAAKDVMIVTLTQGEVEAGHYETLGLDPAQASRLKGRLRTWDSMAIPLWGNVPQTSCLQLGYYCMQLQSMQAAPEQSFGSRTSGECDTRTARQWNSLPLPGDAQGNPTWRNLVADLAAIVRHFRPQVIILPHPQIDPHPDHQATSHALQAALQEISDRPASHFLLYANHLHNNDRWPMGPAGGGITLPPRSSAGQAERFWLRPISDAAQLDKAMALAMHHDLTTPQPWKRAFRRKVQQLLAARRWPRTGENEFFRKAVRAGELFSVHTTLDAED